MAAMDANRKKHLIVQTGDVCANMIAGVRQLRLSVLDLFNTLADTGVDPEKNLHHYQQHQQQQLILLQNQNPIHSHHHHQQNPANNANSKVNRQHAVLSSLATSHTLCAASNPPTRIQKQLEQRQQTDLIQYVDQMISSIANTIRVLDQDVSVLMQNKELINVGESLHLGMDSSLDKHNLFMELCSSYKTLSRLHDYSAHSHALLLQQSLKRVHKRTDTSISSQQTVNSSQQAPVARSESIVATFNPYIYKICMSKQSITSILENYLKLCEHMEGTYSQPFGISTGVLQISVDRVLKAILVMRGIVIDAVVVKAYHESFSSKASQIGSSAGLMAANFMPNDSAQGASSSTAVGGGQFVNTDLDDIDLWSESKYNVFRRLTHHANAAVLHFQYPTYPEIAVRSFLVQLEITQVYAAHLSRLLNWLSSAPRQLQVNAERHMEVMAKKISLELNRLKCN